MKFALALMFATLTLAPRTAAAEPITAGVWSAAPAADNDEFGFYDGLSWDCAACNIGFQLKEALEYLHDGMHRPVGFKYRQFPGAALISRTTAWTDGVLSWDAAAESFLYNTGTGYFHDSRQGTNMVLFRLVAVAATIYWLGVEDIPVGWGREDRDFNDSIYRWEVPRAGPPGPPPEPQPPPIPEPGTWRLALTGVLLTLGWRVRQRA
jgi:hypothetical protein